MKHVKKTRYGMSLFDNLTLFTPKLVPLVDGRHTQFLVSLSYRFNLPNLLKLARFSLRC